VQTDIQTDMTKLIVAFTTSEGAYNAHPLPSKLQTCHIILTFDALLYG